MYQSNLYKKTKYLAGAAALSLGLASLPAQALTVISFGGTSGDAMQKAYYSPFNKETNAGLVPGDYNGELSRIRAMVETGNVSWDLVEVESPELSRGCFEGMFEPLDWEKLGLEGKIIDEAIEECGIGTLVWSTVMAYNADRLEKAPSSWQDFWNVKDFPGKRGLRRGAKYTLEFALLADGVNPKDIYKVLRTEAGVSRAFTKLEELSSHIQWWEAGAQPPQWLVAGDVVMSSSYNGRIAAAQEQGINLAISWNGSIYDLDYWAIVKGSKKQEAAYDFIKFASQAETQAVYSSEIPYGPVNPSALLLLDEVQAERMPTNPKNMEGAFPMDTEFWVDYGEELEQRFSAWSSRL